MGGDSETFYKKAEPANAEVGAKRTKSYGLKQRNDVAKRLREVPRWEAEGSFERIIEQPIRTRMELTQMAKVTAKSVSEK